MRPEAPVAASEAAARRLRRWIVERSLASNVGHVGSALSIVEIMTALWGGAMRDPGTALPDRDRFLLAKGHAALALYGALRWRGLLDEATFATYCGDGSLLGVHPEAELPGVDASSGSLGLSLSVACGLALALRRRESPARLWILMSDAECNEGQVWEAAMFAAHHRLGRITAVIDANGSQALGPTREILDFGPRRMVAAWEALGWDAREVDGHDLGALGRALGGAGPAHGPPRLVVARTVLGKGVSFMEGRVEWHYRNLSPEQARQALREIGGEA